MKAWWRRVRPAILWFPIYAIVRTLLATVRIEARGFEKYDSRPGPRIFAGWHGRVVAGAKLFLGRGFWTIISHSRDGEMQNRIFQRFGFKTVRGSTGRGGVKALAECIRVLKQGETMTFPPDGPRGPSGIVQPGIVMMAKKSGAELVPVGVSANRRWLFGSWDRYMIPKPFSRVLMIFGDPIYISAKADEDEFERVRLELQHQMRELEVQAEREFGHSDPDWHAPEGTPPP